ncbi:MAG: tetratricopeptide repeat protein [Kouleothrix sp.]
MLDEYQREEALIHFQRGLHLERAHRVGEAVEEYRRAIAHDPHLREAHDALGSYYQRHGLLAKAAEEFRVVASLEGDFLSHFNLGCVLLELARYDDALAAFERCRALEPSDATCDYEIGYIHFLKGNYLVALQHLVAPLQQYADDWEVHTLLGNCHLRMGSYDSALEAFGSALRLATHPHAQAQIVEHIRTIERYRDIGTPQCAKDRLYADHGVVYLGSAQDDGVMSMICTTIASPTPILAPRCGAICIRPSWAGCSAAWCRSTGMPRHWPTRSRSCWVCRSARQRGSAWPSCRCSSWGLGARSNSSSWRSSGRAARP